MGVVRAALFSSLLDEDAASYTMSWCCGRGGLDAHNALLILSCKVSSKIGVRTMLHSFVCNNDIVLERERSSSREARMFFVCCLGLFQVMTALGSMSYSRVDKLNLVTLELSIFRPPGSMRAKAVLSAVSHGTHPSI